MCPQFLLALFIILVGLTMTWYTTWKKWWFPLDAYVVSWPACTKNLDLTLLGLSAYRVAIFGLTGCCISWCPPSLFIHKNISFSEMECLWWWYVRCFLFLFQTVFKTLTFLFNVKQMLMILLLKFIYSEKATKFCKIFTLLLTGAT